MSCNNESLFYGIGNGIVKEGIFERFPQLIPSIGDNYKRDDGAHRKMLIVAESNYFIGTSDSDSVFRDATLWYTANTAKLIPEDKVTAVSNDIGYKTFERSVFKIMGEKLEKHGYYHAKRLFEESAFYNYFLRPADKDRKIRPVDLDLEVAGVALTEIIERLNPELVVFVSKLAYRSYRSYCNKHGVSFDENIIKHVSHPSSFWWNRSGGVHGRQKFSKILEQNWLNSI